MNDYHLRVLYDTLEELGHLVGCTVVGVCTDESGEFFGLIFESEKVCAASSGFYEMMGATDPALSI